ncbi:DUF2256 and DUF3253 domain-containing protein [Angustibacter sp. Root456]|uniref:DUF2256 and DUF3253 domain-containing protein n=1 Tax=Angustibacter sp. Root456 TaxID=1736539 RepID=UPI0006F36A22|nr:DUF2256 and DUF3253 domain-containing protein [Angustibacter sp. Root456]KQX65935.1 hypothetical protein ASD06_05910 [Angustibacter sp. Root456]
MANPEPKTCASCGRRIEWRKKWERDWESVRYCSTACRRHGVDDADQRLVAASEVVVTQGGHVVDPSTARDAIRIRRT